MSPAKLLLFLVLLLANAPVCAAEKTPRVLILGDRNFNTPAQVLGKELKGRYSVFWKYAGDSSTALVRFEELMGKEKWDVIYFNFGADDLCYRDPSTKAIRTMSKSAGGVRMTTPAQYETNLRELVKRLKLTGATLIWGNTVPLTTTPYLEAGSEIEYNSIAAGIMAENNIQVIDLHAAATANIKNKAKNSRNNPIDDAIVSGLSESLPKLHFVK